MSLFSDKPCASLIHRYSELSFRKKVLMALFFFIYKRKDIDFRILQYTTLFFFHKMVSGYNEVLPIIHVIIK